MTTPSLVTPDGLEGRSAGRADRVAVMLAGHAVAVGVAADLLLRDGPSTVGAALWVLNAALLGAALVVRTDRTLPPAATAWLAVAVLVAGGAAWRDAEILQFVDFWTTVGALAVAAALIAAPRPLTARLLRELLADLARVVGHVVAGLAPIAAALGRVVGHGTPASARGREAVRVALLAGVPLLAFGALLVAGDPLFASFVSLPSVDLGQVVSHLLVVGVFSWMAAGWMRAALDDAPRPTLMSSPIALRSRDVLAVLGAVTLVFGAYLASQLGWLVGGERFLRERTGLTAAEYARRGFFEMIAVTMLVVPLLLATRAALAVDDREAERRHTRLSLALLAMLALMLVSAVARLALYVRLFGLTTDRVYPVVFLAWLAGVLAWLAVTVLRGRARPFVAGAMWSGVAVLLALHVVPVDALVARWNVDRAARDTAALSLDVRHLAELGGVAAESAVAAVLAPPPAATRAADFTRARCEAAHRLLARWGTRSTEERDWRSWNAGALQGRAAVRAHLPEITRLAVPKCA
ncbi:protein of unknown function DUF4173 [Gemmatirosa kalamazoonensis]|uniref:DUF4173 domain-containing protein n=1 Tax=Gemmatirosa kalamazoonensis TaxID=861299 RepID=W0RDV6_9BACT|nr:DUF4173 domain-containing protein [Gemmatirosa kalamazoonensis]AHG89264.1 protein of unknown function DUF4173 [Gemmatirosa kalamazoonensis]